MDSPIRGARIAGISLDCADHRALGAFYARLLNSAVLWQTQTATGVQAGDYKLVAQEVPDYVQPMWPGTSIVHLDLTCEPADLPRFQELALQHGAALVLDQPDLRWTVMLDPAGHPFCLTPLVG
ncbi:VOC family protein [Arthrobacter pityocampae]|uniref:VOC family protein n=1 Tax=Arthrobacter pityocampae TaxID=547334 RepID=UPI00373598E5